MTRSEPRDRDMDEARRLADHPEDARRKLAAAADKAEAARGRLGAAYDDLCTFFRMLRRHFDGSFREVPTKTILLILGAILYFLSPIDAIPDFLPLIGLTDDVSLLLWVAHSVRADVERFRRWEKSQTASS